MAENVNFDVAEYNSFGPWAYEINENYPLPRLFAPYFTDDDGAVMKIKIPRDIERRDAEPGMDLYDYVIALYEDEFRVLERQDNKVKEHSIPLKDFKGIRIYENLLRGGYTIYSAERAMSFPFNAVSVDLFQKLTNLVLEKMLSQKAAGQTIDISSLPVTDTAPEAQFMKNMLHDVQMKVPGIRLGAVQKSVEVSRKESRRDEIQRLLWKKTNPEALHLFTDKYLVIVENGIFPNLVGIQDLGYTQTIIPFDRIGSIQVANSEDYNHLKECVLSMGTNKIVYHFDEDDKEVPAFYNALNDGFKS